MSKFNFGFNPQQLAQSLISKNSGLMNASGVMNNPQVQSMLNVVQNGDATQGEEIANNLCQTFGVTKEEAVQQAISYFGLK